VTFKDLRRIIADKKKEAKQESKFFDPSHYWKGKKIVSLNEWLKIKNNYGLNTALQYFPNDFPRSGLTFILCGIEDQTLKQEADQWGSDFIKLMEYSRNAEYGKSKCFRCLISTDREEAGIFIRINKVISKALDTTTDGTSVYPCGILNRFACPYEKKIVAEEEDVARDKNQTEKPNVDYLFYLSELAFEVELALAKAQEEDSVFTIRSAADAYEALTNKETLEMVLQQGLKEEYIQYKYKDKIVELFTNMKDRIKAEDLTVY
jgi:hypothetical protein